MKLPHREDNGERPCYTFDQMVTLGFLWYVNKELFNPKGFSLCIDYAEGNDQPLGWSFHGFPEPVEVDLDEVTKKRYRETMEAVFELAQVHGRLPTMLIGEGNGDPQ
jgi:hypothetical protein